MLFVNETAQVTPAPGAGDMQRRMLRPAHINDDRAGIDVVFIHCAGIAAVGLLGAVVRYVDEVAVLVPFVIAAVVVAHLPPAAEDRFTPPVGDLLLTFLIQELVFPQQAHVAVNRRVFVLLAKADQQRGRLKHAVYLGMPLVRQGQARTFRAGVVKAEEVVFTLAGRHTTGHAFGLAEEPVGEGRRTEPLLAAERVTGGRVDHWFGNRPVETRDIHATKRGCGGQRAAVQQIAQVMQPLVAAFHHQPVQQVILVQLKDNLFPGP